VYQLATSFGKKILPFCFCGVSIWWKYAHRELGNAYVKSLNSSIARFGVLLLGGFSASLLLPGQDNPSSRNRISMPYDWSHRHVIFSNPATIEQATRIRQDPRFWHQHFRRNVVSALPIAEPADDQVVRDDETLEELDGHWLRWWHRWHHPPHPRQTLKRDWSVSLGPNATVGAGNYPAKFSFDVTTANCGSAAQPDFVVYNTNVAGSSTQASIVAYDNLYTGCGGTVPTAYWSYNTGGSLVTSVVLSLDGSQIAFIQTAGGTTTANLVLLKWKASTDGATSTTPDPIASIVPGSYPGCTAPCMTTLAFSGGQNDTDSSPFYDYFDDELYVGDDNGSLHKFQHVFRGGTPAEVSSGSWPVTLASGFVLGSPVYDSGTARVFVGSASNGTSGGQLFSVDATTGSIFQTSAQLAKGNGIVSGPIVDSTAGLVYVFVATDTGAITCFNGGSPCSGVYQFSVNTISSGGRETPVSWGAAAPGFPIYLGAFDNSYYSSPNATGSLFVCGQIGGRALLFKLPIAFGFMSPAPTNFGFLAGAAPTANIPCSPITEVFNPNLNSGVNSGGPQGTDKIFVSTQGTDNVNPCVRSDNGGCLYDLPATSWQAGTAYTVGQVILDDGRGMCLQVVTKAGTSSATTEPNWAVNEGISTADGTVTWTGKTCLGHAGPVNTWFPNTTFGIGFPILDAHGNLEAPTVTAMTGSTQPSWPLTIGTTTNDGGQIWINVGPVDAFSLKILGGTSGIVVDNTVLPGTLAGASQVYFSPLGTGFGTCGAGNGCAVQASQAGLN